MDHTPYRIVFTIDYDWQRIKAARQIDPESGVGWQTPKFWCNNAVYAILYRDEEYYMDGNDCIWSDYGNYKNATDCDCSDPENYDFYDQGWVLKGSYRCTMINESL